MDAFDRTADPAAVSSSSGVVAAVRHGLAWLVFSNVLGVMIAVLLLLPQLNVWLGEWTYGRWMIVHMNTALFGWASVPMLAFLFKAYRADQGVTAAWCRPAVWLWSASLAVGSFSWLQGHSSGKLFLDWSGYSRVLFPLALLGLWILLAVAAGSRHTLNNRAVAGAKIAGLLALLPVPFILYAVSNPGLYPAVNVETGGPNAASQLESTLGMVLILLALPLGLAPRRREAGRMIPAAWLVFVLEAAYCAVQSRTGMSDHAPGEWLSLASVLIWIVLVPGYYREFRWHDATRQWRIAFLWWWGGLVLSGWTLFLPGVLQRVKFTDALVGHSLLAVAGFLSAYIVFVMAQVLGDRDAWILNRKWSFYAWNLGVLAYVVVIAIAGWVEGADPAFTIVPGFVRNALYFIRLLTGVAMLAGSVEWLAASLYLKDCRPERQPEASGVSVA